MTPAYSAAQTRRPIEGMRWRPAGSYQSPSPPARAAILRYRPVHREETDAAVPGWPAAMPMRRAMPSRVLGPGKFTVATQRPPDAIPAP